MRALQWAAASFLLVVLVIGVGTIAAFIAGAATVVGVVVGAAMAVLAWHGLRAIEPRHPDERPPDGWGLAIVGVAGYSALLLAAFWNPWLLVFSLLVFPLWLRLIRRQ